MKWLKIFMAALFLLAVGVQYNDPDGVIWMLAYGLVVGVTLLSLSGRRPWGLSLLLCVALLVWGLVMSPALEGASFDSFTHWSMHGNDEVVREVGGLGVAALWTLVLGIYDRKLAQNET